MNEKPWFFFLANATGWLMGLFCNLTFLPIKNWLNPGIILPLMFVPLLVIAAITGSRRYHGIFAIFALIVIIELLFTPGISIE